MSTSLNELELLKGFLPLLPGNAQVIAGAGDDCAVLKWNDEYDLLVTVVKTYVFGLSSSSGR